MSRDVLPVEERIAAALERIAAALEARAPVYLTCAGGCGASVALPHSTPATSWLCVRCGDAGLCPGCRRSVAWCKCRAR